MGASTLWPRSRALQTPAVPRPAPGLDRRTPVVGGGSASPASHAPRRSAYNEGPFVLRVRPAGDLFVELEGWTPAYQIASVGCSLTRSTPLGRSERAVVIINAPLQGRLILS